MWLGAQEEGAAPRRSHRQNSRRRSAGLRCAKPSQPRRASHAAPRPPPPSRPPPPPVHPSRDPHRHALAQEEEPARRAPAARPEPHRLAARRRVRECHAWQPASRTVRVAHTPQRNVDNGLETNPDAFAAGQDDDALDLADQLLATLDARDAEAAGAQEAGTLPAAGSAGHTESHRKLSSSLKEASGRLFSRSPEKQPAADEGDESHARRRSFGHSAGEGIRKLLSGGAGTEAGEGKGGKVNRAKARLVSAECGHAARWPILRLSWPGPPGAVLCLADLLAPGTERRRASCHAQPGRGRAARERRQARRGGAGAPRHRGAVSRAQRDDARGASCPSSTLALLTSLGPDQSRRPLVRRDGRSRLAQRSPCL